MQGIAELFESDQWYKGLIVAGLTLAVGALGFHERDFATFGLGTAVFGFGEWINHPHRKLYSEFWAISSRARDPRPAGLALDGLGLALTVLGLWRIVV